MRPKLDFSGSDLLQVLIEKNISWDVSPEGSKQLFWPSCVRTYTFATTEAIWWMSRRDSKMESLQDASGRLGVSTPALLHKDICLCNGRGDLNIAWGRFRNGIFPGGPQKARASTPALLRRDRLFWMSCTAIGRLAGGFGNWESHSFSIQNSRSQIWEYCRF
jgi:hypothetical protein